MSETPVRKIGATIRVSDTFISEGHELGHVLGWDDINPHPDCHCTFHQELRATQRAEKNARFEKTVALMRTTA